MCVIVHQPIGSHIDKETAQKLWNTNPDGGGFAFVDDDGQLQNLKFMSFPLYWSEFETARSEFPQRHYLMHMRIATHGNVDISNVHPFQVDEYTVMAHNGIIHGVTPFLDEKVDERSDTRYFVEEVLPRLPETWLDDPFLTDMVNEWIGWSKLMFLTTNPKLEYQVYRLGDWKEKDGLYLSNLNGLTTIRNKKTTYTTYGYGGWESDGYGWYPPSESFRKETKKNDKIALPAQTDTQDFSDEWKDWLAYAEETALARFSLLDEFEQTVLKEAICEDRTARFILHPVEDVDVKTGIFQCARCLDTMDREDPTCDCWDLVCPICWNFLALCDEKEKCDQTGTKKFRLPKNYNSLSIKGKEFVRDGGLRQFTGEDRERMEKALSSEA